MTESQIQAVKAQTIFHAAKLAQELIEHGAEPQSTVYLEEVLGVPEAVKLDMLPLGCLPDPAATCFTLQELARHPLGVDPQRTQRFRGTVSICGVSQQVEFTTEPNASLGAQALAFVQALSAKTDVQILPV